MKALARSIVVATLVAASTGLVTMASAMPPDDGPGCGPAGYRMNAEPRFADPGARLDRLASRLDMTAEQRADVRAIMAGSRDEVITLRGRMQANRADLRHVTGESDYDEAEVRRIAEEQGDLRAEMIVLRARQRAEIRSVLTDTQVAQLEKMRQRRPGRGH